MREIIWSVCSGDNCLAFQGFVRSLRASGYAGDIIVWSEFQITGAENIPLDQKIEIDSGGMWKFDYMKKVHELYPDALLAYFGPYHYSAHKLPTSFAELMKEEDAMCFLESDILCENTRKLEWSGINNYQLYDTSRTFGNLSDQFYNLNANHFFVKPDYVNTFYELISEASSHLKIRLLKISDEICLSMVMNTICKNKNACSIRENENWYAMDVQNIFKDKLPDATAWETEEWFTGEKSMVNPALMLITGNLNTLKNLGRSTLGPRITKDGQAPVAKGCSSCQRSKPQMEVKPVT